MTGKIKSQIHYGTYLLKLLKKHGYENVRYVGGLGFIAGKRMAFTYGLFVDLREHSYRGRFCYPTKAEAIQALNEINETTLLPSGDWIKYKGGIEFSRIPDRITGKNYK